MSCVQLPPSHISHLVHKNCLPLTKPLPSISPSNFIVGFIFCIQLISNIKIFLLKKEKKEKIVLCVRSWTPISISTLKPKYLSLSIIHASFNSLFRFQQNYTHFFLYCMSIIPICFQRIFNHKKSFKFSEDYGWILKEF